MRQGQLPQQSCGSRHRALRSPNAACGVTVMVTRPGAIAYRLVFVGTRKPFGFQLDYCTDPKLLAPLTGEAAYV